MEKDKLHNDNDVFLAQWLEGKLTDNKLKKLVSKEDFLSYVKINKTISLAKNFKPKINSFDKIQQKIASQNKTKVKKLYTKWFTTVAATVIFFIGLNHFLDSNLITNKSGFGEQKKIALLDKSEVILNANSKLKYNKNTWKNKREVFLDGEAYFKVSKGNTFTVKTSNGNIVVLGTQFKVNSSKDYFEVVCYEGSVKVLGANFSHILKPNDAYRKINGNKIEKWQSNINEPTWINEESTFKSVPLKYVILKFEDQYHIKFDTKQIDKSIIFSGSFTHKDIDIALQSVFGASNISYKKTNSKNIILSMN
jgi:ferric-dicitrate binding protein FerR (iron transport regulator)